MTLYTICKAYGNAERVRLVVCLSRPATVSDLLKKCGMSQSALSQHLAILRNAGVVIARREGRYVEYKTSSRAYTQLAKVIINVTN